MIGLGGLLATYLVYLLLSYVFGGSVPLPQSIVQAGVENETIASGTAASILEAGQEVLVDVSPEVA